MHKLYNAFKIQFYFLFLKHFLFILHLPTPVDKIFSFIVTFLGFYFSIFYLWNMHLTLFLRKNSEIFLLCQKYASNFKSQVECKATHAVLKESFFLIERLYEKFILDLCWLLCVNSKDSVELINEYFPRIVVNVFFYSNPTGFLRRKFLKTMNFSF